MLLRVVRMVFTKESKEEFIQIFYDKQKHIIAFHGCKSVDLMDDAREEMALATWSMWENSAALEKYRESDLFLETWKQVKPLFAEKARAWSYTKHEKDAD